MRRWENARWESERRKKEKEKEKDKPGSRRD
jgi:hypothetical protein